MKTALQLLILLLTFPVMGLSHAEMFFPKLLSYTDLPNTGIVLLNPDGATGNVDVYLVSSQGTVVSETTIRIAPHRQVAQLASQLFPGATEGGWIYVFTDSEGMQAFWLTYNADLTYLDGGDAAQFENTGPDQIIPLVAGDTELTVLCLSGIRNPVPVTVHLFGGDGNEIVPAYTQNLGSAAALHASISELFPSADLTQARYLRIRTPGPAVASSALIRGFLVPVETVVVNGMNVGTLADLSFPHIVNGSAAGANYTTIIGLTNLSASPQTLTITFNPAEGSPIAVTRDVAGNGALRESAQSLFGLPSQIQTGWLHVSGTAPITGFVAYADMVRGGLAAVPVVTSQTSLFFLHIADGPPQWQTGLALLNASNVPATAEVYAMDPSGSLIGKTTVEIEPGARLTKIVHELIPETRGVNGGFIYLRSTNGVPLYGMELFYTEDLKVLSNVAAGKLAAGLPFVPPQQ